MPKVAKISNEEGSYLVKVPCRCNYHKYDTRWTFNGDFEKPTFRASMLVKTGFPDDLDYVCHSHVTDGNVEYGDDCSHALKSQTLPLGEWDE